MPVRIRESNGINILDVEGRVDINSSDIIETVGWLTNTGSGYTGSSDVTCAHGLGAAPNLFLAFVRDHTNTSRMELAAMQNDVNEGTYVDEIDATNIYVHVGSSEMNHPDGGASAVDIRIFAWL